MSVPKQEQPSAFTLLELLVVIAILALLAALLLPVLKTVRQRGRQVTCANNLRQQMIAINGYAGDHEGWLPVPTAGNCGVPMNALSVYGRRLDMGLAYSLGYLVSAEVLFCPSLDDYSAEWRYAGGWGSPYLLSPKTAAAYLSLNQTNPSVVVYTSYWRPTHCDPPSGIMYCDAVTTDLGMIANVNGRSIAAKLALNLPAATPERKTYWLTQCVAMYGSGAWYGTHQGAGANTLYADGAVRWMRYPFRGLWHQTSFRPVWAAMLANSL